MMALYMPMQPSSKMPMIILFFSSSCGESFAGLGGVGRNLALRQRLDVRRLVLDRAGLEPTAQALEEEVVREVFAPQRAVLDAGLGQAAVEVEHADQARPSAAPVGHGQDRALVRDKAGEDVVAVLPDRLGHDQRRVAGNGAEHLQAVLLAVNEAVLLDRIVGVAALDLEAFLLDRGGEFLLHRRLFGFAGLVGGKAQVPAGHQVDRFLCHWQTLSSAGRWADAQGGTLALMLHTHRLRMWLGRFKQKRKRRTCGLGIGAAPSPPWGEGRRERSERGVRGAGM